ncbi:MAG: phosphotransferase [Mycoplasma sp.]|nr:phosphotransferase [Candidatus Hennigella equi]
MKTENKEFALKLLKKVFGKKNGEIVSIKPIHRGYTNFSFFVTYANGKNYQVRIPHCGDLLNRSNEKMMLTMLKDQSFVYFDVKTGVAIKEWIDGKSPKIGVWKRWKYTDDLFAQIKKIHNLTLPKGHKFKKLNFDAYNKHLFRLKLEYQTKYLSILETYRENPYVLSHTDINAQNLILDTKEKIHIIDYEWCGLAPEYWDYANFIRENRIRFLYLDWKKYIPDFNLKELKDYIFASAVYAFLWTWEMPLTRRLKHYRKRTLRQIRWYGRGAFLEDEQ